MEKSKKWIRAWAQVDLQRGTWFRLRHQRIEGELMIKIIGNYLAKSVGGAYLGLGNFAHCADYWVGNESRLKLKVSDPCTEN
jgi:hypothetical protein